MVKFFVIFIITISLSKPVVGPDIALHAVPSYRASAYTYFLPSPLIQLHFLENLSKQISLRKYPELRLVMT